MARVYSVPEISCGHCQTAIEAAVGALDDVETCTVDIDAKSVTVVGGASDDAIAAAIDDAGYAVAGTADHDA
jgi:copper chaperone